MFKTTVAALALAIATTSAAFASDSAQLTDQTRNQIREKLVAEGYEVGKIKTEDGMYEAYAKKDGNRYEIYLDAQLNVVRTKIDD
ncbi:PepSY domain-containing protein [Marimonas lutisalis]|uniref:PepSY domain-containing protein n=1 Tax=Marimonas lutisalis TaxID=2545756 RepID=UPI0010F7DDB8|nr:PepSY domain-containing protein [Marimonas lutisalis]